MPTKILWEEPRNSKNKVSKAGKILISKNISSEEKDIALDILNNWRSAHALPLNVIQTRLRAYAKKICKKPLIAQRLKRTPSIILKLKRFEKMHLSRMQDIGGCRAVVDNLDQINSLIKLHERSKADHELVSYKNYIENPKPSGYRSAHLVYKYKSSNYPKHNGLMVEIQLRSKLQHAWATGVETVGAFINSPLKSSFGPKNWLDFFSLISSGFALIEKTPTIPGTSSNFYQIRDEIQTMNTKLNAIKRLIDFGHIIKFLDEKRQRTANLFLLHLKPVENTISVNGFLAKDIEVATSEYLTLEKNIPPKSGENVVLVSVDSIASLKKAYPNYFFDTKMLVRYIQLFLERKRV